MEAYRVTVMSDVTTVIVYADSTEEARSLAVEEVEREPNFYILDARPVS